MGIMDGLARGASAAGYAAGDMYGKMSLEDQRATIQAERDSRLAELQEKSGIRTEERAVARADQQRTAQVERVDAAAGKIADKAVEEKRGLINSGITDKESWTPEQQAAVDQSLSIDRGLIASDGRTREKAAVATGDISPKEAAAIDRDQRRLDITDRSASQKATSDERRDETQRYIAELRDNTAQARIEALLRKTGTGSSGTKEALAFIDGVRKDLASEAANLKALYASDTKELSPVKREAVKKEYQPKFDAIDAKRAQIEKDFSALREKVGLPAMDNSTAPAAPASPKPSVAPAGLPQGARQIGTSGGKPVYETPDGKRFVQK